MYSALKYLSSVCRCEISVPSRLATATSQLPTEQVGCPIRKSADQRVFAPPRGLSQRITSFIASYRQGIHQTPFLRSIRSRRRQDQPVRGTRVNRPSFAPRLAARSMSFSRSGTVDHVNRTACRCEADGHPVPLISVKTCAVIIIRVECRAIGRPAPSGGTDTGDDATPRDHVSSLHDVIVQGQEAGDSEQLRSIPTSINVQTNNLQKYHQSPLCTARSSSERSER